MTNSSDQPMPIDERHLCQVENICGKGKKSVQSLCQVKATDIMKEGVQVVNGNWSISTLAKFFISQGISGAPVIDNDEKLIGVVSATDIMEFENISYKEKLDITKASYYQEVIGQSISNADLERLSQRSEDNCTTDSIMTPDIISVQENSYLPSIAQLMSRRHIHRVFVTSNENIIGVISTTDVLKVVGEICNS